MGDSEAAIFLMISLLLYGGFHSHPQFLCFGYLLPLFY